MNEQNRVFELFVDSVDGLDAGLTLQLQGRSEVYEIVSVREVSKSVMVRQLCRT